MPERIDQINLALQTHLSETPQDKVNWITVYAALMNAGLIDLLTEGSGQTLELLKGDTPVDTIVLDDNFGVQKLRDARADATALNNPTGNKVLERVAKYIAGEVTREKGQKYTVSDARNMIRFAFTGTKRAQ